LYGKKEMNNPLLERLVEKRLFKMPFFIEELNGKKYELKKILTRA
jgi:hypothetical protein